MATYLYESIPSKAGQKPKRYEIKQSMNDQPLTRHPVSRFGVSYLEALA